MFDTSFFVFLILILIATDTSNDLLQCPPPPPNIIDTRKSIEHGELTIQSNENEHEITPDFNDND